MINQYLARVLFLSFVLLAAQCSSSQTQENKPQERGQVPTTGCIQGDCTAGDGTFVYNGGDKYLGSFKNGLREGKGTLDYASGDQYIGQFVADKRSGDGTYKFANGDVYVGQFKDGERAGNGVYTFKEGPVFEGTFANDGKSGNGSLKAGDKLKRCELQDRKIVCEADKAEAPATETKTDKK